jgi:putative transposase
VQTVQLEVKKEMIRQDRAEKISLRKRIRLIGLSRSAFYYKPKGVSEHDHELMRSIDQIVMNHPYYGSRRLHAVLRGLGFKVGRHHIRRLMRKMRVFTLYPKKRTSIPNKDHKVYPYLLRGLDINRPGQVWSTDITYIPMAKGFLYLVAVMDWYSRCVLSWRLSTTLDSEFCIEALKEALEKYGCPEIFNSDQGAQFTSKDFVAVLQEKGIKISMDGKGRVYDNIFIERLWRSLKQEEVYLKAYENVKECRKGISEYFELYNKQRPHQALNYQTPFQVYRNGLEKAAS